MWIILIVVASVAIIVLILIGFAVCKSRLRRKQHFERRASLRASIRSSRQTALNASMRASGSRNRLDTSGSGYLNNNSTAATDYSERASGRGSQRHQRPRLATNGGYGGGGPRKPSAGSFATLSDATLDCTSDDSSSFPGKFSHGAASSALGSKSFDGDYSGSAASFNNNGYSADERPPLRQGYKPYNAQVILLKPFIIFHNLFITAANYEYELTGYFL